MSLSEKMIDSVSEAREHVEILKAVSKVAHAELLKQLKKAGVSDEVIKGSALSYHVVGQLGYTKASDIVRLLVSGGTWDDAVKRRLTS